MDHRLLASLQHALQYPSGHLDRFAAFGPSFEMMDASAASRRAVSQPAPASEPDEASEPASEPPSAEQPIGTAIGIACEPYSQSSGPPESPTC